jgi:2-polyprenyl-3-methyl-5-hydroxy-6-metoxy-1,4-benzoquinol methylase
MNERPVIKVEVNCPLCEKNDASHYTYGYDHEYQTSNERYSIVQCNRCGLKYLNPRPDVSELSRIYPDDYYSFADTLKERSLIYKLRQKKWFRRLHYGLKHFQHRTDTLRVLDVGCGTGLSLDFFKEAHPNIETHGVDMSPDAAKQAGAGGHKVLCGLFEELALPQNYYDIVYASHIIEHVADPVGFAQKAHSVLRPGGVFFLETMNIDSVDARLFKEVHWGGYHVPRHWHFFNRDTLVALSEKTGFNFLEAAYLTTPVIWMLTLHSLFHTQLNMKQVANLVSPAVGYFDNNLRNYILLPTFIVVDAILRQCTKETSSILVVMQKRNQG